MNGVVRRLITLSLAWACFTPNLVSGIEKGNTVLVGLIEWTEVTEASYGLRFFLPEGMETVEIENDPFEALVGQTDDGVTLVIQGTPQSVELDGLEEWVVEDLEIDGAGFELVESEDSFHNLAYRLYEARDEEEIVRVMVAQHLKQDFSYVIYVVTPTPLMDAYDTAFFFWFTNIYGLEKVKKAPASTAQDSDPEVAASFYGNYKFDVESSMARCERLNSYDCKDWGSGTHAEVKRAEYRNNFGKLKNMTLSIGPSAFEMGGRKAKYSVELATWELFAISVEDEPLVLLREQSNVICMSATNPNSDVMCFSK